MVLLVLQAFGRIKEYLAMANSDPTLTVVTGGTCDDRYKIMGCFVDSHFVLHRNLQSK